MVAIDLYPELLVRFNPVTPQADYRIFFETKLNQMGLKYPETSGGESLQDWTLRKVGVPNNKIEKIEEIE